MKDNFSQWVREEIVRGDLPSCRGCVRAELAAVLHIAGSIHLAGGGKFSFSIAMNSAGAIRRVVKLMRAAYPRVATEVRVENQEKLGKHHRYVLVIPAQPELREMLANLGVLNREMALESGILPELVKLTCCRGAYIRGAFLGGGSLTDPMKNTYHLELVAHNEEYANGLAYLMNLTQLKAKITARKDHYVVYLKDSEAIARFLSVIGTHTAVMKLEEVRVIKGLRNEVNRLVNCETANLEKVVSAAGEQVRMIKHIAGAMGLEQLARNLRQTAMLRLEFPEASLKELGEAHAPPLSKSAVNHRFRILREIDENISEKEGFPDQNRE